MQTFNETWPDTTTGQEQEVLKRLVELFEAVSTEQLRLIGGEGEVVLSGAASGWIT